MSNHVSNLNKSIPYSKGMSNHLIEPIQRERERDCGLTHLAADFKRIFRGSHWANLATCWRFIGHVPKVQCTSQFIWHTLWSRTYLTHCVSGLAY